MKKKIYNYLFIYNYDKKKFFFFSLKQNKVLTIKNNIFILIIKLKNLRNLFCNNFSFNSFN